MKVVLIICQGILVLGFGLFGFQKIVMPLPELIEQGMLWIEDFEEWQIRAIGILEFLGALGLVIPNIIRSLPKLLVPLAAGGLALTMLGAIITHISRGDIITSIIVTTILFLLSLLIAVKRFKDLQS